MVTVQKDPKTQKKSDDSQDSFVVSSPSQNKPDDSQAPATDGVGGLGKEQEPAISFEDEAKIVAEIQDREAAIAGEAYECVKAEIPETKQAMPEPELAPDLEDAGVVNPQREADRVISQGASLNLPISEAEYKKGLKIKFRGKTFDKSFIGVSSFIALSMWIGRLIKLAHKHAMRVVFRKSSLQKGDKDAD